MINPTSGLMSNNPNHYGFNKGTTQSHNLPLQSGLVTDQYGGISSGGTDPRFKGAISSGGGGFLPGMQNFTLVYGSDGPRFVTDQNINLNNSSLGFSGDLTFIVNPQSLTLSEAILWTHEGTSDPQLVLANLHYRRPSPATGDEVNQKATQALEGEGRRIVDGWAGAPGSQKIVFSHVELKEIKSFRTETNHNPWTGERHWEATGTPVGYLYYRLAE